VIMTNRDDSLGQVLKNVSAIARRQNRIIEAIKNAVQSFQHLLADVEASEMTEERRSVTLQLGPTGAATSLPPKKGSGKRDFPEAEAAEEDAADRVYVTWLLNGVPGKKWFSRRDAKAFVDQHEFDLIANETADTLIVDTSAEQSNKPLCLIPPLI